MPAHDLLGILQASEAAGLKRFVFHPEVMGASEWRVLTEVCGTAVARGSERVLAFGH